MLLADNKRLQQRLKAMQETINSLQEKNVKLMTEKASVAWNSAGTDQSITDLIGGYMKEIEKLQTKLIESDQLYQQLKKQVNSSPRSNARNAPVIFGMIFHIFPPFKFKSTVFREIIR